MEGNFPFKPAGPLHLMPSNSAGASATKILGPSVGGEMNYLITNSAGGADVFMGYGPNSDVAIANRVIPLVASPSPNGGQSGTLHIPGGSIHVFTLSPGLFMAPISIVGSSPVLTVIMGFGL